MCLAADLLQEGPMSSWAHREMDLRDLLKVRDVILRSRQLSVKLKVLSQWRKCRIDIEFPTKLWIMVDFFILAFKFFK